MRKPIIVGNWKMNKTIAEAVEFFGSIEGKLHDDADFGIGAPYLALSESLKTAKGIFVAAQNVHHEINGAFTGEVSLPMLTEIGVEWVILGHSERRQYFNETDELVNQKAKLCLKHQVKPIICVGETLEQFEANQTEQVVRMQVKKCLAGLSKDDVKQCVIAYEPVWAIGTGRNATKEIAQATCAIVRNEIMVHFGFDTAEAVRIQYGGSVKPENIAEYMAELDIDGALIGGASLKTDSFLAIVHAVKK